MRLNKKGAALMQVLLLTVVLAGIATMLLRASLSRTSSARKTRRTVSGQVLIQACMAQVNSLWSKKSPEAFSRDLKGDSQGPFMYCSGTGMDPNTCPSGNIKREYRCEIPNINGGPQYIVIASFEKDDNGVWRMVYEVLEGSETL